MNVLKKLVLPLGLLLGLLTSYWFDLTYLIIVGFLVGLVAHTYIYKKQ